MLDDDDFEQVIRMVNLYISKYHSRYLHQYHPYSGPQSAHDRGNKERVDRDVAHSWKPGFLISKKWRQENVRKRNVMLKRELELIRRAKEYKKEIKYTCKHI